MEEEEEEEDTAVEAMAEEAVTKVVMVVSRDIRDTAVDTEVSPPFY